MDTIDLALHLRLVAGDKTAPDESVLRWLPELVRKLSFQFAEVTMRDEHLVLAATLDALFDYTRDPSKYDPQRSSLGNYLLKAARGDLINSLRRDKTQGRDAGSINSVEQWLSAGNSNFEEEVIDRADLRALWETIMSKITDPLDRSLLKLMLEGERATEAYASVLGIQHLPDQEKRAIVKRHKDRISKRLERIRESTDG